MKRLLRLFWEVFRIALFVVGGGYAIIVVADEVFGRRLKWLREGELLEHLPVFQMVPGLIAGNSAIYEGLEEPGGVLMFGIPEYRLPKTVVRAEIEKIAELGVNFITNTMVGENGITVDYLFAHGFDAIFMGTGTAVPQNMDDVPGAKLHGVSQSTYLLHQFNAYQEGAIARNMVPLRAGERVGVIGGGNVAMDAARTAIRLGADGHGRP